MSKRFNFLTGDINWKQYGGTFYHKEETYRGSGEYIYTLIEVINMPDAVGSDARFTYAVEVKTFCFEYYDFPQIKSALDSYGMTCFQVTDTLQLVECMTRYGYGDLECSLEGNNINKLLKEAKSYPYC